MREAVMLIGIQATGKSTFCQQRLFHSHFRINGDLLAGNKEIEQDLMLACLRGGQPFVLDKMGFTREHRKPYLEQWKYFGFLRVGYFFSSSLEDALRRNRCRAEDQVIPEAGIRGAYNQLELPAYEEGFERLYNVTLAEESHAFVVDKWEEQP